MHPWLPEAIRDGVPQVWQAPYLALPSPPPLQITLVHYDSHSRYADGLSDHETDEVMDGGLMNYIFMALIIYLFMNYDI